MKRKNSFCTYLVHSTADTEKAKALRRNAVDAWTDNARTSRRRDTLEKKGSEETPQQLKERVDAQKAVSSSSKALANHEWYMSNKDWKKEYNQEYYQNNKDYWERRYKESLGKMQEIDAIDKLSGGSRDSKSREVGAGQVTDNYNNALIDYRIAEENVQRARQEYNTFMKNNVGDLNLMVASLRQPQAKSFVSNGIIKITKILKPISGALASQLS